MSREHAKFGICISIFSVSCSDITTIDVVLYVQNVKNEAIF